MAASLATTLIFMLIVGSIMLQPQAAQAQANGDWPRIFDDCCECTPEEALTAPNPHCCSCFLQHVLPKLPPPPQQVFCRTNCLYVLLILYRFYPFLFFFFFYVAITLCKLNYCAFWPTLQSPPPSLFSPPAQPPPHSPSSPLPAHPELPETVIVIEKLKITVVHKKDQQSSPHSSPPDQGDNPVH